MTSAAVVEIAHVSKMKGIGFANVKHFVEQYYGAHFWEDVLENLHVDQRSVLAGVSAVGWYPILLFSDLLESVDQVCGYGDLKLMHKIGRHEAECDYNRILRLFLRVVHPTTVAKISGRLWSQFQDTGDWTFEKTSSYSMTGTLDGWVGATRPLCMELAGYLERLVEFSGGQSVLISEKPSVAAGHDRCVYDFSWR